jgi:hypothetical protein
VKETFSGRSTRCGEFAERFVKESTGHSRSFVAAQPHSAKRFSRWYRQRFKAKPSEKRTRIAPR